VLEMDAADPINRKVVEELRAVSLQVRPATSALRLWERALSEQDRARFAGDFATAYAEHGTVGIWMKLRGVSPERALIEVAKKIGFISDETQDFLLRGVGEISDDPDAAIAKSVADGALVLVARPRTVYWQGEKIEVDWDAHGALWTYFFELCRSAKTTRPFDRLVFGETFHEDYLVKQKISSIYVRVFSPVFDRFNQACRSEDPASRHPAGADSHIRSRDDGKLAGTHSMKSPVARLYMFSRRQ
jgi:hypothetical protein